MGPSTKGLPSIEFSPKYEPSLRRIALLQGKIADCNAEIKTYEKEIEAHSVRIAEVMKTLSACGINVTYSYSLISTYIVIKTDDVDKATRALSATTLTLVDQADIREASAERIRQGQEMA